MKRFAPVVLAFAVLASAADARHPRDPREAFTAADRAWAQRIVLKPGDLPGRWRSTKSASDDDARCPTFDPDMSDLTITGEADSRDFDRGGVFVSSTAEVFRTARETATSFRRAARPQLIRCYDEAFRDGLGTVRARLVSGRAVTGPRVGDRRLALRLVWELTVREGTARTHLDLIGWDRGRASAAVVVLSVGRSQSELAARLAQRMDARMRLARA